MKNKAQAATARRFTSCATLAALGIKLRSMKLLEPIGRNFRVRRHLLKAERYREEMQLRFTTWVEVSCVQIAA